MSTKIDENYESTSLVVQDGTETVVPLLVDPVTDRLLVDVAYETSNDLDVSTKIDENYQGVAMAVDVSGNIKPLKVKPSNSRLLIDLVVE